MALAALCALFSGAGVKTGRSVLLLISDNQNSRDLGCYGNPVIQTPHLDQLAGQGVRFTHAFATTASCGPSRGVIYMGLHAQANGQYGHDLENDPDEVVNLAGDPQHAEIRRSLSERLIAYLERTGDPWLLRHTLPREE
jgi:hypothetical protein